MYYTLVIAAIFLIVALAYALHIRPWILKRGATPEERRMVLPGDNLVIEPNLHYTQAITINSPPEIVWSYLAQVGYRRGGWYNWDFFNAMSAKDYFYENNKSTARIIPELQDIKANDKIYLTPQIGMDIHELEKNRLLVLTGYENGRYVVAWSFFLHENDAGQTRLIVRWNSRLGEGWMFNLVNRLIVEPGGVGVQQSLMLKGIKRRCESEPVKP